jgi:Sec-independent protein secretion pathway component TatC
MKGSGYFKWGLIGAFILSIPGWAIAILVTMGPEFVRRSELRDFIPLIILVSIGFVIGCALKWFDDKSRQKK